MTVIAWDGQYMAADRLAIRGGMNLSMVKIHRVGDKLVGASGQAATGEEMLKWIQEGADPDRFPATQANEKTYAPTLVIDGPGNILIYETTPYPLRFEDDVIAIGCGAEVAMAAMVLGASAEEAVELAIKLSDGCGGSIDVLKHNNPSIK